MKPETNLKIKLTFDVDNLRVSQTNVTIVHYTDLLHYNLAKQSVTCLFTIDYNRSFVFNRRKDYLNKNSTFNQMQKNMKLYS